MTNEETIRRNRYRIGVLTELGCSIEKGEYGVFIDEIQQGSVGREDFDLVSECVTENLEEMKLPDEGYTSFILRETGEWQDVFWCRWYELVERLPDEPLAPTSGE